MAFVLLIIGAVLLVSAVRNTQDDLFTLVKGDFIGANNFIYWFLAIFLNGALGYIPKVKPLSVSFLILVILVLVLSKGNPSGIGGGLFSQFTSQVASTTQATQTTSQTNQNSFITIPNPVIGGY